DGVRPPHGSKFRLLPGDHRLDLSLDDTKMGHGERISRVPQSICFSGRPGHAYLSRPTYFGPVWRPQIIDENTTSPTSSSDCSSPVRRRIARAPLSATAPPAGAPPPAAEGAESAASATAPSGSEPSPVEPKEPAERQGNSRAAAEQNG